MLRMCACVCVCVCVIAATLDASNFRHSFWLSYIHYCSRSKQPPQLLNSLAIEQKTLHEIQIVSAELTNISIRIR